MHLCESTRSTGWSMLVTLRGDAIALGESRGCNTMLYARWYI